MVRMPKYSLYLLLALFAIIPAIIGVSAQDEDTSSLCRTYTAAFDNINVRSCAGTECAVIDTLEEGQSVCVIETQEDWFAVNTSGADNTITGYVARTLLRPGTVDASSNSFEYCDGYRVITEELVVRQCPTTGCSALGTISNGDIICAVDYDSVYTNWVSYIDSQTFQTAWVSMADMSVVTEDRDCDAWRINVPSTVARVCPQFYCDPVNTLQQNVEICALDESGENQDWLGFYYDDDTLGWVFADLVEVVDLPENEIFSQTGAIQATLTAQPMPMPTEAPGNGVQVAQANPTATTNPSACTTYRVIVASAVVRAEPSLDATQFSPKNQGDLVCVLGVVPFLENEWFVIDLNDGNGEQSLAFMAQSLLEPVDQPVPTSAPAIALSNANAQVSITGTPVVCEAGDTSPDCVPLSAPVGALQAIELPISTFGSDVELRSPQSASTFRIFIPQDWEIQDNNRLLLNFIYSEAGNILDTARQPVSRLDIRLDNQLLESLLLDADSVGEQSIDVPLPGDLLRDRSRETHFIELEFVALDHCEVNLDSRISLDAEESFVRLEFLETNPTTNLADYPRPFYENHPTLEVAYVVLPADDLDNTTLTAAGRVIAGLGAAANNLVVRTTTTANLSDDLYRTNNLILVGAVDNHPTIQALYEANQLPSSYNGSAVLDNRGSIVDADDGILQIIQHPDNERLAIMTVTGQNDTALLKASQAIAGLPTVLGLQNNLTLIENVVPTTSPINTNLPSGITFEQLGLVEDFVLSGVGEQTLFLEFEVPYGVVVNDEASINLNFNTSAVLEDTGATLTISVNGLPIVSTPIEPRADDGNEFFSVRRLQANIPSTVINPGQLNFMQITLNSQETRDCRPYDDIATWLTVGRDSQIFLPLELGDVDQNLVGLFPAPFNLIPTLSDTVISIPDDPSLEEINQAFDLLKTLASSSRDASGSNPSIIRGYPEDETVLADNHIIVIGRPSNNSFFADLNDDLPQPFVEDSDQLEQIYNNVIYRLDEGYDVAVMQTITSPYNSEKTILVLTGTDDEQQALAVDALAGQRYDPTELVGDIVFVSDTTVFPILSSSVIQSFEILQAVPALATESALILQETMMPITETAAALSSVVPTQTPITTAAVTTPAATAELPGTAISVIQATTPTPTIAPVPQEEVDVVGTEQPAWVLYLIVATAVTLLASALYALRLARPTEK